MNTKLIFAIVIALVAGAATTPAQNAAPAQQPAATTPAPPARGNRPPPPTRDPQSPGYVSATDAAGWGGPAGQTRTATSSSVRRTIRLPRWRRSRTRTPGHGPQLQMQSTDSKIYPGIRREQGTFGTPDPNNPAKLDVTTSAPAPYTRRRRGVHPEAVRARDDCPLHRRRGRT